MLNKVLIGASLALCVAACVSNPPSPVTSKAATTANGTPAGCVSDTGWRIPPSPSECAAFGNSWTQKNINQAGATDAGKALRLLDPTVTVHQ